MLVSQAARGRWSLTPTARGRSCFKFLYCSTVCVVTKSSTDIGILCQDILITAIINSILFVSRLGFHVFPQSCVFINQAMAQFSYHHIAEQAQTSQHTPHPRRRRYYYYRLDGVLFCFSKRNTPTSTHLYLYVWLSPTNPNPNLTQSSLKL